MLKKQTSRIRKVHRYIITSKGEEILQDKMRLTAAKFTLTLVVMFLFLFLSCICLISTVSASPVVKIEVSSTTPAAYESLTVLNPEDGNWIELIGGNEELSLPTIQLVYSIKSTEYTRGDKEIKITSYMGADYIVNYPFQNYPLYYDDAVTVNVHGESGIAGEKVYICLMSPNEVNSAWNSIFNGDLNSLRVLRDNAVDKRETTLDSAGDCTVSFGTLNPGDYVVSASMNASSAQNMTFISTSVFEVLEHKSSLEPETSTITRTSDSDYIFARGKYNLIGADAGATYNYVVALIRKDEQFDLRWDCDGANSELNLKVSNAPLAKSINVFGGMGLGQLTLGIIYDWILTFQTASVEKGASGTTYDFSLPVMDMPDGDYYLYAMASTSPSGKAFASSLAQKSGEIVTEAPPPSPTPTPTPYRVVGTLGGGGGGVGIIGPTLVSELKPTPAPALPALIISNVSVTIDEDSVFIAWDTNERSNSRVKCGIESGRYTIEEYAPPYVLHHAIPLKQIQLKNIVENTSYYFIVNSTDPSGNSAQTEEYMFILTPPEREREIIPFILQLPQTLYPLMWRILLAIIIVLIIILLTLPRRKSRRTFNSLIEKPAGTEVLMCLFTTFPDALLPVDISKRTNIDLNGVLEALHTLSNKNTIESLLGIGLVDKVEHEGEACYRISKRGKSLMEGLK